MFSKVSLGVLSRSVNFKITWTLLFRRSVFPDYLSVFCDYDITDLQLLSSVTEEGEVGEGGRVIIK